MPRVGNGDGWGGGWYSGLATVGTYDRRRWPLIIHRGLIVLSSATTVSKFEKSNISTRQVDEKRIRKYLQNMIPKNDTFFIARPYAHTRTLTLAYTLYIHIYKSRFEQEKTLYRFMSVSLSFSHTLYPSIYIDKSLFDLNY